MQDLHTVIVDEMNYIYNFYLRSQLNCYASVYNVILTELGATYNSLAQSCALQGGLRTLNWLHTCSCTEFEWQSQPVFKKDGGSRDPCRGEKID